MSATVPQYPWSEGDHLFASALNAAFKNGAAIGGPFLLLAGGTVVGPTIFTETIASGSSVPTLLATQWDVTNTGGAVSTYQFQTTNQTNIHSAAGQTIWANNDAISYSSPTPSATGATYVARRMLAYSSTDRGLPSAGAPGMWAAICDAVDTTGHQSSIAGQLLALEVDVEAGGLDDGNCRQGLVIVGATRNYPTVPTSEFARAFGIFNLDPGVTFKDLMTLAGGFNHAGINMVSAGSIGGAPAIWLGNNKTIAWDDEGAATTHWNGTYLQFSRNVGIDGSLSVGTTMAVHGTAEFFSTVQVDGLLYTPANLSVGGTSALVGDVQIDGKVGFNGTAPHAKPTITGAKAGNAALNSLILSLQAYGLIQDSTTA